MTISRRTILALIGVPLLLALTACGPSDPTPRPTGTSTTAAIPDESESPSPTPEAEETVSAAAMVVTASTISIFGTDGSTLVSADYDMDAAAVAALIAEALGADPVISSTASVGSGCDSDQTMYDFGGLLLRSPGLVGVTGAYEAVVSAPATTSGVVLETVGGQRVGASEAVFLAAVGETVLLGEYAQPGYPSGASYGFDIINPEVSEYEQVGAYAQVVGGALESFNAPYYLYADC